jgi:hypothetical protein
MHCSVETNLLALIHRKASLLFFKRKTQQTPLQKMMYRLST